MRLSLAAWLICVGVAALPIRHAHGMQFQPIAVTATELVLNGRGPIVSGDNDRLLAALAAVPRSGLTLLALSLDSPGGTVADANEMVKVIQSRQLTVVIPHNSQCASACFLMFAASPRRFAATDALIGVHSANQNGEETERSLAVTTLMEREAGDLGVPPSVIFKMFMTTPGRVEWLDPHDLASMHAAVFDGDPVAALHQSVPASARKDGPTSTSLSPFQATSIPATGINPPSGYASGRDDRRSWDAWIGGLHSDYREGAIFALAQLNSAQAGICFGPNNVNRGDFTLGCGVAQQRLAPIAAKLRSSADYATGWNAPVQPINANEPVEQEYQGVYFCASQVVHLTLKVFQHVEAGRRRTLFVFGPNDNSRDVPSGSFFADGEVGLNGGKMILTPVKWLSQPAGYSWFGLIGNSDDGGKTFSGRLSDSTTCTRFTLARMSAATAIR